MANRSINLGKYRLNAPEAIRLNFTTCCKSVALATEVTSFLWFTVKNYLHGLHRFVASSQKFVVSNRPRGNLKGVNFHGVSSKQFVPNFTVKLNSTTLSLE